MTSKSFDKRILFIRSALISKITDNPNLANEWYIANKAKKTDNAIALQKFKEWLKGE